MTVLSVNVNKIAVLRNSRGGDLPDPADAARIALAAGAAGITVHPRPDQRHIGVEDVGRIARVLGSAEYNIEGNPFAPPRGTYPGLVEIARAARPAQVTLVPDADAQITSDHGFELDRDGARLKPLVAGLKSIGCRVSLFMDADSPDVERVADTGADRIEIYTGPYAAAFARGEFARELDACVRTAERARKAGLGVNAGHDLSLGNLGSLIDAIPFVAEVSIGHALIAEAVFGDGLAATVRRYLAVLGAR